MSVSVLVTGGTGFIGRRLTSRLLHDGHRVVALVRAGRERALPPDAEPLVLPSNQMELRRAVEAAEVMTCAHLAAYFVVEPAAADVAALVQANVALTAAVADACAAANVERLVFTGTVWQNASGPAYEPMSLYAATKQAACDVLTHFAKNTALAVDVLKLADTYGPGDTRRKALNVLLDAASSGDPLGMSPGEQILDLVHVDDVVEALVLLLGTSRADAEACGDWALGSGRPLPLREVAAMVGQVTGRRLEISWGERPYRLREQFSPWRAGSPPPTWHPRVTLEDGIAALWAQLDQGT